MALSRLKVITKTLSALKEGAASSSSSSSLLLSSSSSSNSDNEQIELAHQDNNIWSAIRTNNRALTLDLIKRRADIMNERGPVGETPLHMCCLFGHKILARELLHLYPHLITAQYSANEYHGENILHIAIIQKDFEFVKFLVEQEPKLLEARADGNFFKRGQACYYGEFPLMFACCTGQKKMVSLLLSKGADLNVVDSNGNTVLHLLVLHSRIDMYSFVKNLWIQQHKLPTPSSASSSSCPTPTAASISSSSSSSSSPPSKPYTHRELWKVRNADGLSPFTLASKLGNEKMFSFLLEENKQTQWTYGPVSCFLYPLQELDLALGDGNEVNEEDPRYEGALEIIVNQAHLNLLMHPRMIDLVKQKWDRFAQRIFFQRFVFILIYLFVFTITTVYNQTAELTVKALLNEMESTLADSDTQQLQNSQPPILHTDYMQQQQQQFDSLLSSVDPERVLMENSVTAEKLLSSSLRALNGGFFSLLATLMVTPLSQWAIVAGQYPTALIVGNLFVLAGAFYKLVSEGREIFSLGTRSYFTRAGSAFMENMLSLIFSASILLVALCRLVQSPAEQAFLALASVLGWIYLFFFLLAFRLTGPMVVMIYQMLTNDVLRFLTIYSVFLIGFSQAFFVLFAEAGWDGFVHSIQTCFVAMLGDFDLDKMVETPYTAISVGLLVTYVVVITILLVNLLIAMMGDTYSKVNEQAEMQWHLERARIIFSIEHEMTVRHRKRNKYWIAVDGLRYYQVISVNEAHFGAKGLKKEEKDADKD